MLTAQQLHAMAPFGAVVSFSDGTPPPPARHVKKVRDWERRNGRGLFVEAQDGRDGRGGTFTLKEGEYGDAARAPVLVVNRIFGADSPLAFEIVTPPPAFAVLEDVRSIAPGWFKLKDAAATREEAEQVAERRRGQSRAFPVEVRAQAGA